MFDSIYALSMLYLANIWHISEHISYYLTKAVSNRNNSFVKLYNLSVILKNAKKIQNPLQWSDSVDLNIEKSTLTQCQTIDLKVLCNTIISKYLGIKLRVLMMVTKFYDYIKSFLYVPEKN